jgi:pimeloyl-ACP methyl ester carboxylesterase
MSQMSFQLKSETLAYDYMLAQFKGNGNAGMVRRLEREYTLGKEIGLWRGKIISMSLLRDKVFATDLTQRVTRLDLPVYFFSGIYDYTVNYTLAKGFFEKLQAPIKGFYTFEQSAHSPIFEEPEKSRTIMREDVLAGATRLADR